MKQKGQSAAEFMILVGAALFFFVVFMIAVQENISDRTKENQNLLVKEVALAVQNEIGLATESSDGYAREFFIPETILGSEYEIDVVAESVYLRTTNGKHAIALPVTEVVGNITKGTNIIQKESGRVCLNVDFLFCTSCGNTTADTYLGEQCDSSDLDGKTCGDLGFGGGSLNCTTSCLFDTSECIVTSCGNGILEGGEECDDDNTSNGDGCSSTCTIESGWKCVTCGVEPSDCAQLLLTACNNDIDDDCDGTCDYQKDACFLGSTRDAQCSGPFDTTELF